MSEIEKLKHVTCVVLLIIYPKLILQWSEHFIVSLIHSKIFSVLGPV